MKVSAVPSPVPNQKWLLMLSAAARHGDSREASTVESRLPLYKIDEVRDEIVSETAWGRRMPPAATRITMMKAPFAIIWYLRKARHSNPDEITAAAMAARAS